MWGRRKLGRGRWEGDNRKITQLRETISERVLMNPCKSSLAAVGFSLYIFLFFFYVYPGSLSSGSNGNGDYVQGYDYVRLQSPTVACSEDVQCQEESVERVASRPCGGLKTL